MKKKHIFESIVLFVLGIFSGTILNHFFQNTPLWKSIIEGMFLGLIIAIVYIVMVMFWGYLYDENYPSKLLIIFENSVSTVMLWYSMITFTTDNEGITSKYAWIHIVFVIFSILIVLYANNEGKKIRKANEKHS